MDSLVGAVGAEGEMTLLLKKNNGVVCLHGPLEIQILISSLVTLLIHLFICSQLRVFTIHMQMMVMHTSSRYM